MDNLIQKVFTPYKINQLEIKNRLIMAPMTRSKSPNSIPGEDVAEYYKRRAEGEIGLIITEGTTVDTPNSSNDINIPTFFGQKSIDGWKRVVEDVHESGGLIFPQLWHQGTMRRAEDTWNPEIKSYGPSGLSSPGKEVAEPMTSDEIEKTIDAFVKATILAKEIGFDGVEYHGAHGYLLDQFFWEGTNIRSDEWGGENLALRSKFASDIVKRSREEVGKEFPLIIRFSQWKQQDFTHKMAESPDELKGFLDTLVDAGIDAFHCSQRRFWENEFDDSPLNLAGWTKKLSNKPVITVGSIGLNVEFVESFNGKPSDIDTDLTDLLYRLNKEEFDFIAIGRALISNPDWAQMLRNNDFSNMKGFSPADLEALI